jgi:RNA polymerase sigma-70 factor (ECF subfamily)
MRVLAPPKMQSSVPDDCCHIFHPSVVMHYVDAESRRLAEVPIEEPAFDFERVFRAEYPIIARVINRVVQDAARAQELAAEVFWKLSQTPKAQGANTSGWLYRTATRMALDELRKQVRRDKYERLFSFGRTTRTPEELHLEQEEQGRVRIVLSRLKKSQAELLILRSNEFTYEEIAQALDLNSSSIGTLLRRAEEAFRKQYVRQYGLYE